MLCVSQLGPTLEKASTLRVEAPESARNGRDGRDGPIIMRPQLAELNFSQTFEACPSERTNNYVPPSSNQPNQRLRMALVIPDSPIELSLHAQFDIPKAGRY